MRRIFADLQFDTVINFNGYAPLWAAKLCFGLKAKKKVIFLHNDLNEDRKIKNPGLHSVFSLYRFYDKLFCVSEDSLAANAHGMAAYTRKVFGIDVLPKMDYVNNLILPDKILMDAEMLKTMTVKGEKHYLVTNPLSSDPSRNYSFSFPLPQEGNINFITIGRLSPEKNHLRLLQAYYQVQKDFNNTRLYIVGQGVMKRALVSFVKEHKLDNKVVLIDYLHNPYPLLKLCDCFVLPSDIEGQGLVILEALVLGKHVISTDIPGPRNMLKNGEGQLVPCSSEALAEAMRSFIKNNKHMDGKKFDPYGYVNRTIKQFQEKVLS
jgi:CDP-glycerol glycerophosphotransferase